MPRSIQDRQTLINFLKKFRRRFGKAQRTWIIDRGIPTEDTLALLRKMRHRIFYLVGTPKGRLSKLANCLQDQPWKHAREKVMMKLIDEQEELFVWVESADRVVKERSMQRRRLKVLIKRLGELMKGQKNLRRDELMMKLGQAKKQQAGQAYGLMEIAVGEAGSGLSYRINRKKLRIMRKREGCYLLRTNLTAEDPAQL